MSHVLEIVLAWDGAASEVGQSLRWQPLTLVFLLASTWWVKWPLIAAIGAASDARCRRRCPRATLAAVAAVGAAGLLVTLSKELFDRARPPAGAGIDPVGLVPASASFPSGHAATAFAAAVAVGLIHPRLRLPLLGLAAVVALSRVYLGVHYATDVLAGTALGVALGLGAAWLVRTVAAGPRAPLPSLAPGGTSFVRRHRSTG